ncbi:putative ABC transporter ATP-binding protein [Nymphon striatum]|nr:putative ABC transporter ATP-binding protein [Nymphon striatum]
MEVTSPNKVNLDGTLIARGLTKSYRGRRVVDGAGMAVRRGEAVGLLGPNGAACQCTNVRALVLVICRKKRLFFGVLVLKKNIMAVLEVVEKDRKQRNKKLDQLLEEFSIAHLRKAPSIALSGGERRRCEIARALAADPTFMLLDEPFAGVDPIAVSDIQQLVRHLTERGLGVLITDHNVRETLGLIDRAYIIHSGSVLTHGRPDEIIANKDVRRLYLGNEFKL